MQRVEIFAHPAGDAHSFGNQAHPGNGIGAGATEQTALLAPIGGSQIVDDDVRKHDCVHTLPPRWL